MRVRRHAAAHVCARDRFARRGGGGLLARDFARPGARLSHVRAPLEEDPLVDDQRLAEEVGCDAGTASQMDAFIRVYPAFDGTMNGDGPASDRRRDRRARADGHDPGDMDVALDLPVYAQVPFGVDLTLDAHACLKERLLGTVAPLSARREILSRGGLLEHGPSPSIPGSPLGRAAGLLPRIWSARRPQVRP
jgi:hypothetical protein